MICVTHQVEYKGPNSRGNLWHVIDYAKKEYCNLEAPKPPLTPAMVQKSEEIKKELSTTNIVREPIVELPVAPYFDKRSYRIERQHSQEQAIRFLELLVKVKPEEFMEMKKPLKDMVKEWTDHFVSDLDASPPSADGNSKGGGD